MEQKRLAAYTAREKAVFLTLIKSSKIIESKKLDAVTLQEKSVAWKEIARRYNAHPQVVLPRSAAQLRKLWDNLKQRRRKLMFEQRGKADPLVNFPAHNTSDTQISIKNEIQPTDSVERIQETPSFQHVSDFPNETDLSEKDVRMKIVEDERVQQQELHSIRVEIAREGLRKARAETGKAEAEEQLALLQLQHYKRVNNL